MIVLILIEMRNFFFCFIGFKNSVAAKQHWTKFDNLVQLAIQRYGPSSFASPDYSGFAKFNYIYFALFY